MEDYNGWVGDYNGWIKDYNLRRDIIIGEIKYQKGESNLLMREINWLQVNAVRCKQADRFGDGDWNKKSRRVECLICGSK